MKTLMLFAFVASLFVGCVQVDQQQSTVLAKDHESEVIASCFDSLVAGPTDTNGQMKHVAFVNGSCQGKSKALNLIIEAREVTVIVDGARYESPLYIKGNDVVADVAGRDYKVATLSANPADAELTLITGAKTKLDDKKILIEM